MSSAPLASAWAVSASEGWETSTWLEFSGLACAPSRLSTVVVAAWVSTVRTWICEGRPSKCRYFSAAGKPTRISESISGASTAWFRMPVT